MMGKNKVQTSQQTIKFFETLLRASADGIVITDPAKNIIFVNDTFCKFFAMKKHDVIETNLFVWLAKLDNNATDIWKGLETRTNEHGIAKDVEFAKKAGEGMRYFSVNSSLLEKIDIEEKGLIISIWRDDTERKMAQKSLQQAHDELEVRVEERTAQLQESERKYRRLFEYSNDIIIQVDKFGKVVAINNKIKETLGYTPEEVLGKYFFQLGILEIKELPGVVKQFKKAVVEGKINPNAGRLLNKLELSLRTKSGNLIFVETSTTVLKKDGKIEGFLTNIRDITDRKQAENILHIQKDIASSLSISGDVGIMFDQVLKTVSRIVGIDSGGIYISDDSTGGLILRAHYGFSPEFVQEVSHFNPDTEELKLIKAGKPFYLDYSRDIFKNKKIFETEGVRGVAIIPVVQKGRVIGSLNMASHTTNEIPVNARMILETISGQLREILARIEAEERLKDTKNYLDTIIKSSYDSIFVVDEEGKFEFGNEAFFNLLDYPDKELVGHSFMKVIHPDYHDFMLKQWDEVQRGEGKPYEVDIVRKDGTVRSLSVSHTDMELAGKRRYCVIAKDITESKRMGQVLKAERDNLVRIFEAIIDGVYIVDKKYDIHYVNNVLIKDFGPYEGRKCYEYFHGRAQVCPWCKNEDIFAGKTVHWEWYSPKNDKTYDLIDTPLINPDGTIFKLEMFRDITERKRNEEEARFNSEIFKNVSEGIHLIGLEDGLIKHTNSKFEEMFGYGPGEMIGKDVSILNAPTVKTPDETKVDILGILRTTGEWHGEIKNIRKDGTPFWSYANVSVFDHPKYGRVTIGVHTDITERKQTEDALRESEEKYRVLVERSNDGIVIIQDGIVKFANTRTAQLWGGSVEGLLETPMISHIHPNERDKVLGLYKRRLDNENTPPIYETILLRKDGTAINIEINAGIIRYQGKLADLVMIRDITQRKQAEEQIQMLKHSIDTFYDGIYWLDTNNKFIYVNDAGCKIFGYSREELLTMKIHEVNPKATEQRMKLAWDMVRTKGFFSAESVHRRKDGTEFPVEIRSTYVEFAGREYIGGYARDLSEQKHAEKERIQLLAREHEARAEAEAAKKLDHMKSMFIASTSHELRTPLNSIIGFTSLILDGASGALTPDQKEQLTIVHSSGKHLLALINEVIDISMIEAGRLRVEVSEFNLVQVVKEAVSNLNIVSNEKKLELQVDVANIKMISDRTRMLQCMMNLISNAVKYTEKGSVKVTAKVIKNKVEISVTDTGIGIKPEDIPKLFGPFVRLQSPLTLRTSGTGLGLYLVKKLAGEFLGGDLEVKSEFGKGSTFTLRVPVKLEGKV